MQQNTNIPDSRAVGSMFSNNNGVATNLVALNTYYKINVNPDPLVTTEVAQQRFNITGNKLTYVGVDPITAQVSVVIGAKAPSNNAEFSIVIAKDGVVLPAPSASMASTVNNQSFQITLITEVNLVTGESIEVFLSSATTTGNFVVEELQFRATD